VVSLVYLAGFVLLDKLSFVDPILPFAVTPWNPETGLSFALILVFGAGYLPLLYLALFLGNLAIRRLALPLPVEFMEVLISGTVYGSACLVLQRPALRFDSGLSSLRDLFLLVLVACVAAGLVASLSTLCFAGFAGLAWRDYQDALIRYWIGDAIGIVVVTPFLLTVFLQRTAYWREWPKWEIIAQTAALIASLWLVFHTESPNHIYFYWLFLPVTWVAVRTGFEGAAAGVVVAQCCLIAANELSPHHDADITDLQLVMMVLAVSGLVTGMLERTQRQQQSELRRQQEVLAKLARRSGMAELATAIAHEINQPLAAASLYTHMIPELVRKGAQDPATTIEVADKAVAQIDRARDVVRRLRELVRGDPVRAVAVDVRGMIQEAILQVQPDLEHADITLQLAVANDVSTIRADGPQMQQVLINLLRNAIEALREAGRTDGNIAIVVLRAGTVVEFRVRDNGPGFPAHVNDTAIWSLTTTKPDGLGIGLSLCHTIVEAHGGKLWICNSASGAEVQFNVPIAGEVDR
jgi:two-component system sensor kinase FixL